MSVRYAWLTPDEPEVPTAQRWELSIPPQFVMHVRGALGDLAELWNWEERGDMSPQECADAGRDISLSFARSAMIGTIIAFATSALPSWVLLCDGSVYDREDYPDLYAVLDGTYIDDEDTFHVPDLIDRSLMGTEEDQGEEVGEAEHTLTVDEIPSHTHTIPYQSCFPYGEIPEVCVVGGVLTQATGATGGGESHNNVHPCHKVKYGIVAA